MLWETQEHSGIGQCWKQIPDLWHSDVLQQQIPAWPLHAAAFPHMEFSADLWMGHSPHQTKDPVSSTAWLFRSAGFPQSLLMHQRTLLPFHHLTSPRVLLSHTGSHCCCSSDNRAAPSSNSFPVNNSQTQSVL